MTESVDLPSDDGSECWSLPSIDDMPDDSLSDAPVHVSWTCSCKDGPCVAAGSDMETMCKVLREGMQNADPELHRRRVWLLLRDLRLTKKVERGFQLNDVNVCRPIFMKACCIGSTTLKDLQNSLHLDAPPPDGRRKGLHIHRNSVSLSAGQQDMSKFFFHAWTNYAMHVPTEDPDAGADPAEPKPLELVVGSGAAAESDTSSSCPTMKLEDSLAVQAPGADEECHVASKCYLPHQSFQEFYEMYVNWSDDPVSKSSFHRYYNKTDWKNKLRIADSVQHGKCACCEKLKKMRKEAVSETQLKQIQSAHSGHVKSVMLDRNCDSLAEQLGVDSVTCTASGCPKLCREKACLTWTQDGMDQSKFRCPRNTSMSKSLTDCWRPQISAHGVTFDGLGKFLFTSDQDLGKGSDVQCTVTARALEVSWFAICLNLCFISYPCHFQLISFEFACRSVCQVVTNRLRERGVGMPLHWRCLTDNACSESKNNLFLKFLGVQVALRKVNTAVLAQGRVGHTHNRQDAAFSNVATCLSRATVLENPDDFRMRIQAHLPSFYVEHIEGVADFSSWLAPLATHVSGIFQTKVATEKNLEACHCLKLIRRELLPKELVDVLETPRCLKNVAADPRDVVLLPKLYIGSTKLSQRPIVYIPWKHVAALTERPPCEAIPRTQFSARQSKEFLKTAEIMGKWGHEKAMAYLRKLVPWLYPFFRE